MPRTFEIVDSEGVLPTLSFIDGGMFALDDDGTDGDAIMPSDLSAQVSLGSRSKISQWRFHSLAASVDNAFNRQQALHAMLRKALLFETSQWQLYPVYLKVQHDGETNPRYAILRGPESLTLPGLLTVNFEKRFQVTQQTLRLVHEYPWRADVPGVLPTAITLTKTDGSVDKTRIWVSGEQHSQVVTHVYNYDSSLTAWSANLVNTAAWTPWSVSGATPAAGDILYIGSNVRAVFAHVIPISATVGNFSADVVPEAYISGAWTALTLGTDYEIFPATDPDNLFKTAGETLIAFYPGGSWQTVAINSVTAYWVRLRLNSVSSWTTTPITHASETDYTPRKSYVILPSTALGGDGEARVMLRLTAPNGGAETSPCHGVVSRVIVGAKSVNLSDFVDTIPLHQYGIPSGWARTLGTDAAETATPGWPDGYVVDVSFATNINLVERVQLYGTSKMAPYEGRYRVLLIANQVGGVATDLLIQLKALQGGSAAGSPVWVSEPAKSLAPPRTNGGFTYYDFGEVTLPFARRVKGDSIGGDLVFKLFAQRSSGSATLRLWGIRLIPVDEWACEVTDPTNDLDDGSSALRSDTRLDVDWGVLADRAAKYINVAAGSPYLSEIWLKSSSGRSLRLGQTYRFYFVLLGWGGADWGNAPLTGHARTLGVEFYKVNGFLSGRGSA